MTRRLVAAMSRPVFKIWGHGLGRLLGEREPYACRVEEVLDALARSRGAVEVNGDPHRLDLEPRWIRAARDRGIPLVLSVDAHSTAALGYLRFAVTTARRGWARRGEVLNTLGAEASRRGPPGLLCRRAGAPGADRGAGLARTHGRPPTSTSARISPTFSAACPPTSSAPASRSAGPSPAGAPAW